MFIFRRENKPEMSNHSFGSEPPSVSSPCEDELALGRCYWSPGTDCLAAQSLCLQPYTAPPTWDLPSLGLPILLSLFEMQNVELAGVAPRWPALIHHTVLNKLIALMCENWFLGWMQKSQWFTLYFQLMRLNWFQWVLKYLPEWKVGGGCVVKDWEQAHHSQRHLSSAYEQHRQPVEGPIRKWSIWWNTESICSALSHEKKESSDQKEGKTGVSQTQPLPLLGELRFL